MQLNIGYIQIGTSHDTSEFACDSFRHWWYQQGRQHYPNATSILVLCDGGGSNRSRHYIFKQDLQCLANEIGIEIRIAHYPPYCSKYNPIEHRIDPHVTRACQGVLFTSIEWVKELMEKASTSTGLKTFATVLDKVNEAQLFVAKVKKVKQWQVKQWLFQKKTTIKCVCPVYLSAQGFDSTVEAWLHEQGVLTTDSACWGVVATEEQ